MRRAICTLLVSEPSITVSGEVCSYSELLKFLSESTPNVILLDIHMGDQRNVDVGYLKCSTSRFVPTRDVSVGTMKQPALWRRPMGP